MTECEEVAETLAPNAPKLKSFTDAIDYVRRQMPDASAVVVSNVAWALWESQNGR